MFPVGIRIDKVCRQHLTSEVDAQLNVKYPFSNKEQSIKERTPHQI